MLSEPRDRRNAAKAVLERFVAYFLFNRSGLIIDVPALYEHLELDVVLGGVRGTLPPREPVIDAGVLGAFYWDGARPVVLSNAPAAGFVQDVVLAHELFHLLSWVSSSAVVQTGVDDKTTEQSADRFAMSLCCPCRWLLRGLAQLPFDILGLSHGVPPIYVLDHYLKHLASPGIAFVSDSRGRLRAIHANNRGVSLLEEVGLVLGAFHELYAIRSLRPELIGGLRDPMVCIVSGEGQRRLTFISERLAQHCRHTLLDGLASTSHGAGCRLFGRLEHDEFGPLFLYGSPLDYGSPVDAPDLERLDDWCDLLVSDRSGGLSAAWAVGRTPLLTTALIQEDDRRLMFPVSWTQDHVGHLLQLVGFVGIAATVEYDTQTVTLADEAGERILTFTFNQPTLRTSRAPD